MYGGWQKHRNYQQNHSFEDFQVSGPFKSWVHTHTMLPCDQTTAELVDQIRYELPFGSVGQTLGGHFTKQELQRMFRFRHQRTQSDLVSQARHTNSRLKRILLSGSTGFIGGALTPFLTTAGCEVVPLTRHPQASQEIGWAPESGAIDGDRLEAFDAVVHLAGENVLGRWSAKKKRQIRDSRVLGTRLLCETLAARRDKPAVLVSASAIGIYGDRGNEIVDEQSDAGSGFLASVCQEWETACQAAVDAGIRVVQVRIGLVLSPQGGLLKAVRPLFQAGLGGRVGNGRQWMSWIAIDDLIDIVWLALNCDDLQGPVNAVAPHPVTSAEFTKTLGRVIHRPALLPVPAAGVRLLMGDSADETALSSTHVRSMVLEQLKHPFRFAELGNALRFLFGTN